MSQNKHQKNNRAKRQRELNDAKADLKNNIRAMENAIASEPEKHPWWNKHGQAVIFLIGLVMILVSIFTVNNMQNQINSYKATAEASTSALSVVATQSNAQTYLVSCGSKLTEAGTDSEGYDEILECGNELATLIQDDYSYPENDNASISTLNEATEKNNQLLSDIESKAKEFQEVCKKYHPDWFETSDDSTNSDASADTSASTDSNATESADTATE